MKAYQATWPIVTQCRVLEVSPSGYYAWRSSARPRRGANLTCCLAIASKRCIANHAKRTAANAFKQTCTMRAFL